MAEVAQHGLGLVRAPNESLEGGGSNPSLGIAGVVTLRGGASKLEVRFLPLASTGRTAGKGDRRKELSRTSPTCRAMQRSPKLVGQA